MRDRELGIVGVIGSAGLLYVLRGKNILTRALPTAIIGIIIVLCLVMIFRKEGNEKPYDFRALKGLLPYAAVFVIYIILLPRMGFVITTSGFIIAFLILQKYQIAKWKIVLFGMTSAMLLWLLFAKGFGVRLPTILIK